MEQKLTASDTTPGGLSMRDALGIKDPVSEDEKQKQREKTTSVLDFLPSPPSRLSFYD